MLAASHVNVIPGVSSVSLYMVVDLKVLVSSVYDDDPEHIKISFGESFFSSWRK